MIANDILHETLTFATDLLEKRHSDDYLELLKFSAHGAMYDTHWMYVCFQNLDVSETVQTHGQRLESS